MGAEAFRVLSSGGPSTYNCSDEPKHNGGGWRLELNTCQKTRPRHTHSHTPAHTHKHNSHRSGIRADSSLGKHRHKTTPRNATLQHSLRWTRPCSILQHGTRQHDMSPTSSKDFVRIHARQAGAKATQYVVLAAASLASV